MKRIGLATSEGELASLFKTISVKSLVDSIASMIRIIEAEKIDLVVVGMPEGKTGKAAKRFVEALKKEGLNVETSDETLSTQNAGKLMIEMGIPRNKRRQNDVQAAAEILQNYLDTPLRHSERSEESQD